MKTIKEMTEVMLAYDRGEQIEFLDREEMEWHGVSDPTWDWNRFDYRVKPKPKYVPFETAEEFITAQRKKGNIIINKGNGTKYNVFTNANNIVYIIDIFSFNFFCTLPRLFEEFTFTDGTPCGKEVKV